MSVHRAVRGGILLSVLALAVVGCAAEPTTTPAPTTVPTTPTPTTTTAPAVGIPTNCDAIGSSATRAANLDALTLQGDGTSFIRPGPASAELVLGCDWFGGDATGYLVLISTVDPGETSAYVDALAADGWQCGPGTDAGDLCSITTPNSEYPVDTVETIYTRGDVWIYQSASNTDGAALLRDLQASIWGS